jgi:hypothetical protein
MVKGGKESIETSSFLSQYIHVKGCIEGELEEVCNTS